MGPQQTIFYSEDHLKQKNGAETVLTIGNLSL